MLSCQTNMYSILNHPGWPDNKEKCTNLFNYCITYVDKHNNTNKDADSNDLEEDDPFVVKVILGQLKLKI